MTKNNNIAILSEIYNLKKDLLNMRIKKSSGAELVLKLYRSKKKEIARLFTKINSKKQ